MLGGLEARIERHRKRNKRHFSHIDYLLDYSEILGIIYLTMSSPDAECKIASNLGKSFKSVKISAQAIANVKAIHFLNQSELTRRR